MANPSNTFVARYPGTLAVLSMVLRMAITVRRWAARCVSELFGLTPGVAHLVGRVMLVVTCANAIHVPPNVPAVLTAASMVQAGLAQSNDPLHPTGRLPHVVSTAAATPTAEVSAPQSVANPAEVTVVPGDSMWRIAERCIPQALGRPASTREVAVYWVDFVEANRDRFVDPSNADLVLPGQTFVLPAPPPVVAPPIGAEAATGAIPIPPAPSRPTDPPEPGTDPPTGTTVPQPPDASSSPDGDQGPPPIPATTSTGAERSQPAPTMTTPPADSTSDPVASPGGEPGQGEADSSTLSVALLVGAGVTSAALAVGATRVTRRRRRRRNHHVSAAAPPTNGDQDLHRPLVLDTGTDLTEALADALDGLAVDLAKAGHGCRPRIVQHAADHLDVLLDRATVPAVTGWQAQADGRIWSLDSTDGATTNVDPRQVMAAPLLVTLGEPDDGGQLYLDLEAAQVATLAGDPEVAHHLASDLIAELAHSPFTDNVQIILVGDIGSERHADLDRVTVVDDWSDVAGNLTALTEQSRRTLTANGWSNSFVARGHDPGHPALAPLVVFAAEPPDAPDLLTLVQAGPTATAVVVIGHVTSGTAVAAASGALSDPTIIDCQPGLLSLPQHGLSCRLPLRSSDNVDGEAERLDAIDDSSREELGLALARPTPWVGSNGVSDPAAQSHQDPTHQVLVRFLGEISVDGGRRPLTAKQTALVAYIALHRSVSADRAADAVWITPSAASPRKRLANLMTKCRGALGPQHLPVVENNHYTVGPAVVTDLNLFDRRVNAAAHLPPQQAAETLHRALDLVRGPIFGYPGTEHESYAWVALENWISHWELQITTAARRATELYLDLDDPGTAVELSDRLHRIMPTDAGLTEALMRAHAANGNRHIAQRVYQAHAAALEQLELDTVAESTLALHQQLRAS